MDVLSGHWAKVKFLWSTGQTPRFLAAVLSTSLINFKESKTGYEAFSHYAGGREPGRPLRKHKAIVTGGVERWAVSGSRRRRKQ